jgi:hypothetical protein
MRAVQSDASLPRQRPACLLPLVQRFPGHRLARHFVAGDLRGIIPLQTDAAVDQFSER